MRLVTAYKSTHPDVLAVNAINQERFDEMRTKVLALKIDYPDHAPLVSRRDESQRIVGLSSRNQDPPGPLWRLADPGKRKEMWVPNKKSKDGKALAARLDDLSCRFERLPGMPTTVFISSLGKWFSPGYHFRDGVAWVNWDRQVDHGLIEGLRESATRDIDADAINFGSVDFNPDLWQRAKASEWCFAVEGDE